jgi:hypothetical protein
VLHEQRAVVADALGGEGALFLGEEPGRPGPGREDEPCRDGEQAGQGSLDDEEILPVEQGSVADLEDAVC